MRISNCCLLLFLTHLGCSDFFRSSAENVGTAEAAPTAFAPRPSDERVKALTALGYFDRAATKNPDKRSVTKEDETAYEGLNLYGSRDRARAYLMDNSGKVLHTWAAEEKSPPWMHMVPLPTGELVVISKGNYLAKLDWNSKLIWKRSMGAHHDVTLGPDGKIYVLTHKINRYRQGATEIPIMDDSIVIVSSDGKIEKTQKLFPILRELISTKRLDRTADRVRQGIPTKKIIAEGAPGDTTHTNSIQILTRPIPGIAEPGDILLSVREIDRIVILDRHIERVLWSWGKGELEGQHHATHLDNGNIMIFDNGVRRKQSRVIEMNPVDGKIVWTYTAPGFYSRLRGSAQKLPNGHVLTVESDKGHAIEVTQSGKQVWEFWNPDVRGRETPTRAVIYRLMRYPSDYLNPGLLPRP